MNKDIEINNNSYNNSCNNDHDNNNNNKNEYIIKLYNSVWNNIYLKRIIFHHLNIFNILLPFDIKFYSIEDWQQYKYKEYLNETTFDFDEYDLNQLPKNIEYLTISKHDETNMNQVINSIPTHIESFRFYCSLTYKQLKSITGDDSINSTTISKLKNLSLYINLQHITEDPPQIIIPPSITNLIIYGTSKIKLTNSLLPTGLKVLDYDILESFEDECLPRTLTHVTFGQICDASLINQLSINSLVRLKFDYSKEIDNSIKFPNTLEILYFSCDSFNATIPNQLKSFVVDMVNYKYEIQFPSSLENIQVTFEYNILKQEVFQHRDSVPINLKSLLLECSTIVDIDGQSILPDGLEKLTTFGFNKELKENQLPSSLTRLILSGEFDQAIGVNVLPSTLKILELLGDYSHIINPLAIPQQLEMLLIPNSSYYHPINLPVSTHPNTLVRSHNLISYYDSSNTDIRSIYLNQYFNSPLSTLQLQDKSNLRYLNLGRIFNHPIQLSDLPIYNNIKTLSLSFKFKYTINLEHFQKLELLIIQDSFSATDKYKTITTTIDNNGVYNYYSLKYIQVPISCSQFIKHLDINFYKFIIKKINNIQLIE